MSVHVWVKADGAEAYEASPECIAIPGPRLAKVERGRITDLSIYQVVVNALDLGSNIDFDLEACQEGQAP